MAGIAIVASGCSDLGDATARHLRRNGYQVVVMEDCSPRDPPFAETGLGYVVDMGDPGALKRCMASIRERHGRIDCLIQIAPGAQPRAFLESTLDDFDRVIADNLTAAFTLSQAVAREMQATGGGAIVLVADSRAIMPQGESAIFAASQAALVQLVRTMAVDLSAVMIRVNAVVAPIELQGRAGESEWEPGGVCALAAEGSDIAVAAVFLASAEASYINGHILDATMGAHDAVQEPCRMSGHRQISRPSLGNC